MPKLTLCMQMSLDGYAEGPDHAFDRPVVGPKRQRSFLDELRHADAFVCGRHISEMMASVWPAVDASLDAPPEAVEFARIWLGMPEFVFSQTSREPIGTRPSSVTTWRRPSRGWSRAAGTGSSPSAARRSRRR